MPSRPRRTFRFPAGRLSLQQLLKRTGLSRSRFFAEYRHREAFAAAVDMRQDARGLLNFCDVRTAKFAAALAGERATGAVSRAANLGTFAKPGAPPPSLRGASRRGVAAEEPR
jgi:hypothetical protein